LVSFRVAPALRGRGLGRYLLDLALSELSSANPSQRVYDTAYQMVDVHTHLVHHARAAELYRRRGFEVDAIWVNLVKT
jgi:ribosomal protein S18 acetylase RimI-like enzyme